jgi:hypothetical protein
MSVISARGEWIRSAGMTVLLVMLAVTIFVLPLFISSFGDTGRTLIEVFFVLVLLSGAWAIAEDRSVALVVAALAVAAAALAWLPMPFPGAASALVHQVAAIVAVILLAIMVAVRVFSPGRITTDRIMGAVALYLLIGVIWGNAYEIVAQLEPRAFAGTVDPPSGAARWFYFSFVTLTTVGYGDITPVARAAQVLAIAEALIGQLYPAIILARLVTLQTSGPAEN